MQTEYMLNNKNRRLILLSKVHSESGKKDFEGFLRFDRIFTISITHINTLILTTVCMAYNNGLTLSKIAFNIIIFDAYAFGTLVLSIFWLFKYFF